MAPLREEDYGLIESAVMETARGRWFLSEYARRNRSADTRILLDAIKRLERVVSAQSVEFLPSLEGAGAPERLRLLMAEAGHDIAALLATSGSDADRVLARRNPAGVLDRRLSEASALMDALIATMRSVHDAVATESAEGSRTVELPRDTDVPGPGTPGAAAAETHVADVTRASGLGEIRGRLAQALDRLTLLSKHHHGVVQAMRRGAVLFQALEQAMGGEHTVPERTNAVSRVPSPAPVSKFVRDREESAPSSDQAGRIVIIRTPGAGSRPDEDEPLSLVATDR